MPKRDSESDQLRTDIRLLSARISNKIESKENMVEELGIHQSENTKQMMKEREVISHQ
jgi:hypothetical protein